MRKNYCRLFLLLFLVLGTISCKKSILDVNGEKGISTSEISAAKEWYEIQLKTSKTGAKTNIGFLKKQIAWEQLVNTQKDNITLVPFSITGAKNNKVYLELLKNEKGEILSAKYVFLLSNEFVENTKAQNMIISKQNIENFSGAIIEYDLNNSLLSSNTYKNGIVNDNEVAKIEMRNDETVQNRSIDDECVNQICTAWYWVSYDPTSSMVYSATYLYTSCVCAGVVETGGGVNDEFQVTAINFNPTYNVFTRVNTTENWAVDGTCNIVGTRFTNNQNNIYTSARNANVYINATLSQPTLGGPYGWPGAQSYCIFSFNPTSFSGLTDTQHAFMTGRCSMSYINKIPVLNESFQRGRTWDARFDF